MVRGLKERLGFTLVIVVAGLGTALITGNEILAAIIAIVIALGMLAAWSRRSDEQSTESEEPRRKGSPFTYDFSWDLPESPDLERIVRALEQCRLEVGESPSPAVGIVVRSGSQLRTRLLGGYFVAPRHLPLKGQLMTSNGGAGGVRVDLVIEDTLMIALRDGALERRYRKAAENIRVAVESGWATSNSEGL